MEEQLSFAKDLAFKAGRLISDNFEAHLTVTTKSDNTPVTEVDRQINQLIIKSIKSTYPTHGLLGEEENLGDGNEEFQWVCDPLDGTKAFILGIPTSTFCLALTKHGQILLSVVYHPYTKRLFYAVKGGGAFCNDQKLRVNNHSMKNGYILVDTESYRFVEGIKAVGAQDEAVSGSGYEFMLIASGRAAGMIKNVADYHDVGPGSLIVEEAGGKVSAIDGSGLRYDNAINGVIVSNGVTHEALVAIAKQAS